MIVRSSSFPPEGEGFASQPPGMRVSPVDASGVRSRPQSGEASAASPRADETSPSLPSALHRQERPGRSTPAERPRKRKALQDHASADLRARCDTPRLLPGTRTSSWPSREPAAAAAAAVPIENEATGERLRMAEAAPAIDEVTRRVRRPSAPSPLSAALRTPRAIALLAGVIALCALAVWLLA